jgi:hypothetical protein
MTETWLNSILTGIAAGSLLPSAYFAALDCDAALDARDQDADFDGAWSRLSKEVDRRWDESIVPEDHRRLAEDIRRESFLTVSRATTQHDIASYVSDDFDLIVRSRLVNLNDPFLERLWTMYEHGQFPHPHG